MLILARAFPEKWRMMALSLDERAAIRAQTTGESKQKESSTMAIQTRS